MTELQWSSLRNVADERHFHLVGKHGVEWWFRVPTAVYEELIAAKTNNPYIFAAYSQQLRQFHEANGRDRKACMVKDEFKPANLANWLHDRLEDWSERLPNGRATMHVFRKTSMQHARDGVDINLQVAADIHVSPGVMTGHYVKHSDEQLRQASNRTYCRIVASMATAVRARYGHIAEARATLQDQVKAAAGAGNWSLVARLSAELASDSSAP